MTHRGVASFTMESNGYVTVGVKVSPSGRLLLAFFTMVSHGYVTVGVKVSPSGGLLLS